VVRMRAGGDYGWPECYYDPGRHALMLAPEYGGDGRRIGLCAHKLAPAVAFPAHWAPNDLLLYEGQQFPAHYRHGAFIAFHGSWDRAPYAQGGYSVVFQPLRDGRSAGQCEIFADGFAGALKSPGQAAHRPSGLALAPDGSLYISDDVQGRIYRVSYRGTDREGGRGVVPCPAADAPAGPVMANREPPPEGVDPNAGTAAQLRPPPGANAAMVALGEQIYRGQIGAAPCTGCHGQAGEGTPLGPALRAHTWLWSDGSYAGIEHTIGTGVAVPKQYRSAMPAMGGAQLSAEQLAAVAAYVWALGHAAAAQ